MALENPVLIKSGEAADATLATLLYHAAKVDSNGRYTAITQAGEAVAGIVQNKPAALGAAVSLMVDGITKMVASEAISRGALVSVSSTGRARVAKAGDFIVGICQEFAASASGDIISVLLCLGSRNTGAVLDLTVGASAISSGLAMKFDGSGNVIVASSAGENILGFAAADAASGAACRVIQSGYVTAVAGAAITRGAKVATTAAGRMQTAATGNHVVGIATTTAAANGDAITVLVSLGGAPLP